MFNCAKCFAGTKKPDNKIYCRIYEASQAPNDTCDPEDAKRLYEKAAERYRKALDDVSYYRNLSLDLSALIKRMEMEDGQI